MVTGFNTDVQYEGRVFHVQTEDKGLDNPVVESLVYTGGEIVTSRRSSYADIAKGEGFSEVEVQKRMEAQHQGLIREILSGRYDPEGPKPFGYNIITNRSLDDVVQDFLQKEVGLGRIRLEVEGHPVLEEGSHPSLLLRVIAEGSERPVAAAKVVVKLISSRDKPRELYAGTTDADGRATAAVDIPVLDGGSAALLFQADAAGNNAEVKQLVLKPGSTTA